MWSHINQRSKGVMNCVEIDQSSALLAQIIYRLSVTITMYKSNMIVQSQIPLHPLLMGDNMRMPICSTSLHAYNRTPSLYLRQEAQRRV